MPLGFRLRAVKKEEYGLPVGVLAGVKGLNEDVLREAGQAIKARGGNAKRRDRAETGRREAAARSAGE